MRFRDTKIRTIVDLFRALARHIPRETPVWFRGQANASWKLKPYLARKRNSLNLEQSLMKRFKQNAHLLLADRPQNEIEWLFVMQHHGVPTRLLDWTESPLTGLYFAVTERFQTAGALWALLPVELNQHANIRMPNLDDIPAFDEDRFLDSYLPSELASEEQSRLSTVAFLAPRNTTRSQAQLAVFTITHRDLTAIERMGDGGHVWRYIIPPAAKLRIRRELERPHVTRLTLFPELENVGIHTREILK